MCSLVRRLQPGRSLPVALRQVRGADETASRAGAAVVRLLRRDARGEPFTTVTGLTPGQAYAFTVTATNPAGTGLPSKPSR